MRACVRTMIDYAPPQHVLYIIPQIDPPLSGDNMWVLGFMHIYKYNLPTCTSRPYD